MGIPYDLCNTINRVLLETASNTTGFEEDFEPQVRSADERFGDFQANGVLPYAKRNQQNPRELAQKLIDNLPENPNWEVSLAGPGFINFTLSADCLLQWLRNYDSTESLKSGSESIERKKVVLDFSSPNTAKQMHVGHIRSTIIGESLSRLLAFKGHDVIKDNHLGDWGTQFGILLYAIKRSKTSLDSLGDEPIAELEKLYRQGNQWTKEDEGALTDARDELVKLQNGDGENLTLWEKIRELSLKAFEDIYEILGVQFDHNLGESFYRDQVNPVYHSLIEHKICKEDEGALVVFHPEHKRFAKQPFIIRKSDGASNYATTDLATISYRVQEWNAEQIIYVTDSRQKDHFEQLFLTSQKWFKAEERKLPKLSHVAFGTILGEDNKAIKTRDGEPIKLIDLLNEAIRKSAEMVREKSPDLEESEIIRRAEAIGLGAVKYADLSQDRTLDYVFSWEKLLALQGNTAPYLQYAVARIRSIFRKTDKELSTISEEARPPSTESERKLARKLMLFPLAINQTEKELKPHFLCTYLYELATEFSSFYNCDKVMVDEKETFALRIMLCQRTLTWLSVGLEILGIDLLEEM